MTCRDRSLDAAKGIGIVLVVYAHIIDLQGLYGIYSSVRCIYSFHMPLFFFLSGYLVQIKSENISLDARSVIKKRIIRLGVPYFFWSLIYMILAVNITSLERWIAVFTGRGIAPLWFLAALLLCELAFVCVNAYFSTSKYSNIIYLGLILLLFSGSFALQQLQISANLNSESLGITLYYFFVTFSRFFYSFAIYLCGYLLAKSKIMDKINSTLNCIGLGATLLAIAFIITVKNSLVINLHLYIISSVPLFIITSLCGSVGVMMIAKSISKYETGLNMLGRDTLGIMVLHYPPFPWMKMIVAIISLLTASELLISAFTILVIIAICIIEIKIIKKINNKIPI